MGKALPESHFEPADAAQWTAMVEKLLRGAPVASLDRRDEDGLITRALYPVVKGDAGQNIGQNIGIASADTSADTSTGGWSICAPIKVGKLANAEILTALASGATALMLKDADTAFLAETLDEVVLPAVGIGFQAPQAASDLYHALMALAGAKGYKAEDIAVDLGIDPFPVFSNHARKLPDIPDKIPLGSAEITAGIDLHASAPASHRLFCVDGWAWHNRGLTNVQELAFTVAAIAEILRKANDAGIDPGAMAPRISVRLALPSDMFSGIAKLRAMRILWAGLLSACGVDARAAPLHLAGWASLRMMSILDAEVNMLRTTTALLGGAIGGADAMAAYGHDALSGESAAASRMVRMTQMMMIAESHLAASFDPSAGAPFIESRSDDFAEAGWAAFQEIERAGGLPAALASGVITGQADRAAAARDARLCSGEDDLLGVTLQPLHQPVAEIIPEFSGAMGVGRPATCIEDLRRSIVADPPRLLVILGAADARSDADVQDEKTLRRWLNIAGLNPLFLAADDIQAITTARPDFVIGCGATLHPSTISEAGYLSAAQFSAADDKVAALHSFFAAGKGA
jgi:methylmalonyl-CoA mutase